MLEGGGNEIMVKLDHSDIVSLLPENFKVLGSTDISPGAAYECPELGVYFVRNHPVSRSKPGYLVLMLGGLVLRSSGNV